MKSSTRQILLILLLLYPILIFSRVKNENAFKVSQSFEKWNHQVKHVRFESPDSALLLYQTAYDRFLSNEDTLAAVNALVWKAFVHGHQGHYQSAYDHLWKALLLADHAENDLAKIIVYINLGRYYSFYKRREKAIQYFQSALQISRNLVKQGKQDKAKLVSCYYALCATYRELNETALGKSYLDSCFQVFNPNISNPGLINFLKFEEAYIRSTEEKYQQALDSLLKLEGWFEKKDPGYRVLLYTYIGDNYVNLGDATNGEYYYQKALSVSKSYHSHLDFSPTIHERLSNLYRNNSAYEKALNSLQMVRALDSKYFDSRSKNNRSLLEIKDEFRVEKEKQRQLIQQQRLKELEHEEREAFLKNTILLVCIIFLCIVGLIYFNYVRNKHQTEKALIQKKKELEVQQAQELLDLKNRELAASSLKLIEKDEILATLKEKLSKGDGALKSDALKKIVRTITHSNQQNWEEFEARFISVNKGFYEKLNKSYPKLSRGEQKLCALVKLNLSSKEMAKLLGISIESVHTNRYRLRKKLNLDRQVSLTEFVATL